ncbi:MAG: hypothetical protein HY854_10640 [Burkholderiales bacterium]|nr:hypothetical protein [Burkholderiales bacterium]
MGHDPIQVLRGAQRAAPLTQAKPSLLVAGATGVLGNEVLNQLTGSGDYGHTYVLAREPMRAGLRRVELQVVPSDDPANWPHCRADAAVVMFEPPRLFYERERALWTPQPGQLPALAAWLHGGGVTTLAVVLPHAQGRLPEALKRGLASLDEQAVAALGFSRLLIVRSAQKPPPDTAGGLLPRIARFMMSGFKYMVPSSEQPVRAAKIAQLVALALELAPPGIHVAPPELAWRAAQGDMAQVVAGWVGR